MSERDKLIGCMQSFFRGRHGSRARFHKSKRNQADTIPVHRDACRMVRHYIGKIREINSSSNAGGEN